MSRLSNRVAIVTGASKGIGAGIATALAAEGARVAVNYSSDREGAERVAQTIIESGGKAMPVGADVSKTADVVEYAYDAIRLRDSLVAGSGLGRAGRAGVHSGSAALSQRRLKLHADPKQLRHAAQNSGWPRGVRIYD